MVITTHDWQFKPNCKFLGREREKDRWTCWNCVLGINLLEPEKGRDRNGNWAIKEKRERRKERITATHLVSFFNFNRKLSGRGGDRAIKKAVLSFFPDLHRSCCRLGQIVLLPHQHRDIGVIHHDSSLTMLVLTSDFERKGRDEDRGEKNVLFLHLP